MGASTKTNDIRTKRKQGKSDSPLKRSCTAGKTRTDWKVHLLICKNFVKKNNHGDIPYNFVYKGVRTGRWVSNQRAYSKKKGGMQYIRCSDRERIKAFDEIGVDLRPKKGSAAIKCDESFGEKFMRNYAALCKWRNENGGFVGVPTDLKDFCTEVRKRYASKNLSEDQTNCLVNIDFPWTDFDEGFKQLMTFKMSEKHFNVPEDHVCFSWTKEIRRLYKENNLPEMAQHILVANGFPFNDPILPCPRRTDESSHIKFTTIDKRPVNDVMVGGQRSSVSRKNAGSNTKRRTQMASNVRGNSNDDGHNDGYNDGKSHGYDGNANNKDNYDEDDDDDDDDDDAYDDYDKGDHGGHDDDDHDDDSKEFDDDHDDGNNEDDYGNDEDDHNDDDDNDEGFNHSSNATRFATGRGQPAKQRVVSMQKSRTLKGPRNVLREYDSDDSGYSDRHAETDIDDAANSKNNSDSICEEENDDLNNPIFGSNATLSDEVDSKRRDVEDSHSKNDSIGSDEEFDAEPSNKDDGILADVASELASNDINKEPEIINMNKVKNMKKDDLKKGCKEYGLETDGTRSVLISRLHQFYSENPKYNPKNW